MSVTALPSTATVASELVELCRVGKNLEAIDRLYSPNVYSIEPVGDRQMPAEMHGVDAVRVKNEWWFANHDIPPRGGERPVPRRRPVRRPVQL